MADVPESEAPKDIALSIIDTWKLKSPSVYLALPPEFLNHVGGIVITWGMFETSLEDCLTAILTHNEKTYKGWQYFSLEQRLGIFQAEIPACFASTPETLAQLQRIAADADVLRLKRNALVHGTVTLHIDAGLPFLVAAGVFKKKPFIEKFSKEQIDDLYYEIIHLAGRMAQFSRPLMGEFEPLLPSHEISFLRVVLSKNQQPRSTLSMIAGQPRPSGA